MTKKWKRENRRWTPVQFAGQRVINSEEEVRSETRWHVGDITAAAAADDDDDDEASFLLMIQTKILLISFTLHF